MRQVQRALLSLTCLFALTMFGTHAIAQTSWLTDYYTSAGAAVNITPAESIATQSVTGRSGGSLVWRVPNKTVTPFSITPPSVRGGCSGINAFGGAYSFVNSTEFVQTLRNSGQAALGYLFELALRSLAPEVAVTLDAINDIAQKVNQFNMNSCEVGKWAANNIKDLTFGDQARTATGYATEVGGFVDWFSGKQNAITGQAAGSSTVYRDSYRAKYGTDQGSLTSNDVGKSEPVDINATYWVLKNAMDADTTDDEKTLIMALIGTEWCISGVPDRDNSLQSVPGCGTTPSLDVRKIAAGVDSTPNFPVRKCANAECTLFTTEVISHRSFTEIIRATMTAITTAVVARTPIVFNTEQQTVMKMTSIPVWRAAAMEAGGLSRLAAQKLNDDMAQLAGFEAAGQFVRYWLRQFDSALATSGKKLPAYVQEKRNEMHARVVELITETHQEEIRAFEILGDPMAKIQELERIERKINGMINTRLQKNLEFSNR